MDKKLAHPFLVVWTGQPKNSEASGKVVDEINDGTMSQPSRPVREDEVSNPVSVHDHDLTQDELTDDPDFNARQEDTQRRIDEGDFNDNGEVNDAATSGSHNLSGTTSEELAKQPSALDDRGRLKGLYLDDVEAAQMLSRRTAIEDMHTENKRGAELVDAPNVSAEDSQTGLSESAADNDGVENASGDFGQEPESKTEHKANRSPFEHLTNG